MLKVAHRADPRITSAEKNNEGLMLKSKRGKFFIMPITSDIVRVMYSSSDIITALPEYFCYKKQPVDFSVEETDDLILLITDRLSVEINRNTASITYKDVNGNVLLKEREVDARSMEEFTSTRMVVDENTVIKEVQTADGIKRIVTDATTIPDKILYKTRLHLKFADGEGLYGLGQHEEGSFNLRGTTQYLHQANMKISIPMLVSNKGWGILLTGGSPAVFNDTAYGSYIYTEADIQMDYFFIAPGSISGVIKGYRYLSGKAAMLPRWATGYVQSQERYKTQEEILSVAKEYHERGIGLDLIVLDWESWVEGLWGQKTFDPQRFPNPKEMTDELHQAGVRFMVSIWPNMNEASENYNEFLDANLLLPASDIYNALDPKGRELYWKQARDGLYVHGLDAWWCDSNEPFTPEWTHLEKPEPGEMYHEFYETASKYMPAELCNAYGVYHAFTTWYGQRGETEEKRVCVLTRNGYIGQQAYGSIIWSGDISASWDTLRKQIPAGLNMMLSGIPYWTLDSGAFFVAKGEKWFWNGDYDNGVDDLRYCELSVRWMQYATFLPIMRGHGTDFRREFWRFGDKGTPFYDALVAANRLRYKIAPYIYSACGDIWLNDNTMMKPLVCAFPLDEKVVDIGDEFMLGDSILVCPITDPMYYGDNLEGVAKSRGVYLPAGCEWINYHTLERFTGGNSITVDAPLEYIPVFIKAGSIIPCSSNEEALTMDAAMSYPILLNVYSGCDAEYHYYEDCGDGYGYEKGEYRVTTFCYNDKTRSVSIANQLGNLEQFEDIEYEVVIIDRDS